MSAETEKAFARKGQTAGLVIAGAMLLWLGAQLFGADLGLTARHLLLLDFAALAAFFWAMVVVYQMWQTRRNEKK